MRRLNPLQPAFAAFLAVCVLLLGLAAVSPELHEFVCTEAEHQHHPGAQHDELAADASAAAHPHHDGAPAPVAKDDDHGCAVRLFAHGCTHATPEPFVSPPVLNATNVAHFTELMLARTLRGPARVCGPPALV